MVRLLSWRFDREVPSISLDAPLLFLPHNWPVSDKRIIRGRPFGVGLIVRIITYNKEHPHE
jgi:hypothetical protein